MRIGDLCHRISLQTASRTSDGGGGSTVSWTTSVTVWASIEPANGREPYIANQLNGQVSHKITIRYRSGVTTGYRVLFGTRTFDVQAVLNKDERNELMTLYCLEVL